MAEPTIPDQHDQRVELVEERLRVEKRSAEFGRARIEIAVETRQELVDVLLHEEEIRVDRTNIGRFVDEVPPIREEDGVLVVPVVEEQLVVETRLVLKEELRISRRVTTETVRQVIPLRSEHATVRRVDEPELGPSVAVKGLEP
ncbi:MAG TPA: YsnF/AvaK domain-containing protein [Geminicoccus sp.]|jgi:uncharacterized protein (TIGR02271 family)|uniref:YsnF/AvaK domain-containing protein n=1 Tax=Geminicoccus sp. TaxID=2024832 RepID=UPI002E356D34|nr:YsnF/AvaK domain-containing protein [Geminicoccus sp.]HEX2528000.1 YsnF/AvaK domain-containing protein [Geminicoccus sp.]